MAKPVAGRGLARDRVIEAALELFAKHGVSGTSLQMIGDQLGITKASVYYQFSSKEEIVLAVMTPHFEDVEHLIRIVEMVPSVEARRDVAIGGLVELVIRHRRTSAVLHNDPTVNALIEANDHLRETVDRLYQLMLGPDPDTATRVAVSLALSGSYAIVGDPGLAEISDDDLRGYMLDCFKRCIATDSQVPASSAPARRPAKNSRRQPARR